MKLPRRTFLHLAAGAAALPTVLRFAWAQAYPTRPVRILVGFPPGSAAAPAARCRKVLRGSFILNLPLASHHSITSSARTNSGSAMGRRASLHVDDPHSCELIQESPYRGVGSAARTSRLV